MTNIPDFDKFNVSTITAIAKTNLELNLEEFFSKIPVLDVDVPTTLKKKSQIEKHILSQNFKPGSILTLEYKGETRGFKIKKRKQWSENEQKQSKRKFFRNTVSVVVITEDDTFVTIKIPKQGKMQVTGCQSIEKVQECIRYIWQTLMNFSTIYKIDGTHFKTVTRTVMTNIDFRLGFDINQVQLDRHMNINTEFHSFHDSSLGYTGVNIKKPYKHENTEIDTMDFIDGKWVYGTILYNDYLETLTSKEKKEELSKRRNNTFLVFGSGSTIMSGMSRYYMKPEYYRFMNIISKARKDIEEKIES